MEIEIEQLKNNRTKYETVVQQLLDAMDDTDSTKMQQDEETLYNEEAKTSSIINKVLSQAKDRSPLRGLRWSFYATLE